LSPAIPAVIDLTEIVYDLDVPREDWVPSLLETGLPLFDHGHGVVALLLQQLGYRGHVDS
jgi:hypothetical protein